MKRFIFLTVLSVFFVSPYAFAQIPSCPCDTTELPNGNTGDLIVDILCPDGKLAAGNDSIVDADEVLITRPGGAQLRLVYLVSTPNGIDFSCTLSEDIIGNITVGLNTIEEYEDCRQRLIQGCNLNRNTNIPTLSEWGMIAMAGILGMIGLFAAKRRRKATA